MSGDENQTGGGSAAKPMDAWSKALDEQVAQWREAAEKMSQFKYGPADAAQDFQSYTERMMRLWGLGWPGAAPCADSAVDRNTELEQIEAQYKRAQAAAYAFDAHAVSQYYSEDVLWILEFMPTVKGRPAMEQTWEWVFSWKDLKLSYGKEQLVLAPSGDMAWECGWLKESGQPAPIDGKEIPRVEFDGRYAVTWEKRDGEWLMTMDIQNSKVPPPAPPPPPDLAKVRQEIEAQYKKAQAAAYAFDAKAVSRFYSEDVVWLLEFMDTVKGRADMEKTWEWVFSWKDLKLEYGKEILKVAPSGDMAWECGWIRESGKPAPIGDQKIPPVDFNGRYVVTWEKRDGEWLMTMDIQNSLPPPTLPAAAAKGQTGS